MKNERLLGRANVAKSSETSLEKLLTTDEAANFLGVKSWTVRSWCCERRIPFVKVGRLVRFDRKRLERWILENTIEPSNGHE